MDPAAPLYPVVSINNCGNVTGSHKSVRNNRNISGSDEKRQVLRSLSPLASRERYQAVRDTRADGVGDWLLRTQKPPTRCTFEDRAAKPVLLCYGDPGVRKTYTSISSLVIDTPPNGIGVAVTYVYCDYSVWSVQSASTVLRSVLRQVVGALMEIPDEVQKAFEHAKRQVCSCGLRPSEMLIVSLPLLQKGFICIEALDEFPTKQRVQFWGSLQRVVRQCPNTRLFITGRPQIGAEVENYFPKDADMITIKPTLGDIGRYIEKRLKEDLDLNAMDKELRADILRVIPERIS